MIWVLFSLPPTKRGKILSKQGVYAFIRHPIYTTIIFHLNVLFRLPTQVQVRHKGVRCVYSRALRHYDARLLPKLPR